MAGAVVLQGESFEKGRAGECAVEVEINTLYQKLDV